MSDTLTPMETENSNAFNKEEKDGGSILQK